MSYWVELHCDVNKPGNNAYGEPGCFTYRNENIGVLVVNLSSASRMLNEAAVRKNWVKVKNGWACQYCNPYRKLIKK